MGNILTLKRRGMMEKPDTAAHTPAVYDDIDDLTFDYDGNQIVKVTDAVDDGPYYQGAWHYRDNADAQQERFYDGNGNLTKDLDAKISDIQYNSLNLSLMNVGCGSEKPKQVWFFAHLSLHLPIMIAFIDGSTTQYTYDGLIASSSSIATPSSSYPANQPYRYNGKELDRKNNLDWMDYGAMKLL